MEKHVATSNWIGAMRISLGPALATAIVLSAGCTQSSAGSASGSRPTPGGEMNAPTRAACSHVKQAIAAQAAHDWKANIAALNAAWTAGQAAPGHTLGDRLQGWGPPSEETEPEALADTQSLNEVDDGLALLCHLPLAP